MKLRDGHTYRVYDQPIGKHRHLAIAFDPAPTTVWPGVYPNGHISLHWKGKNDSPAGYGYKWSKAFPLPKCLRKWAHRAY